MHISLAADRALLFISIIISIVVLPRKLLSSMSCRLCQMRRQIVSTRCLRVLGNHSLLLLFFQSNIATWKRDEISGNREECTRAHNLEYKWFRYNTTAMIALYEKFIIMMSANAAFRAIFVWKYTAFVHILQTTFDLMSRRWNQPMWTTLMMH